MKIGHGVNLEDGGEGGKEEEVDDEADRVADDVGAEVARAEKHGHDEAAETDGDSDGEEVDREPVHLLPLLLSRGVAVDAEGEDEANVEEVAHDSEDDEDAVVLAHALVDGLTQTHHDAEEEEDEVGVGEDGVGALHQRPEEALRVLEVVPDLVGDVGGGGGVEAANQEELEEEGEDVVDEEEADAELAALGVASAGA